MRVRIVDVAAWPVGAILCFNSIPKALAVPTASAVQIGGENLTHFNAWNEDMNTSHRSLELLG
jgi:hypothetical protein